MKKIIITLLALFMPLFAMAYTPNPEYWEWHYSNGNYGYFIQTPSIKMIKIDEHNTAYRANIQVVSATNNFMNLGNGAKFMTARVEVVEDSYTGDVFFQFLEGAIYTENRKLVQVIPNKDKRKIRIRPEIMPWRIYEMIIKTYNRQTKEH